MEKKSQGSKVVMNKAYFRQQAFNKLYMSVQDHMYGRLSSVVPNRNYELKQMCSEEFWAAMTNPQKRMTGTAFALMVSIDTFPIQKVFSKRKTKIYKLK